MTMPQQAADSNRQPECALAVVAHPDDADFVMAGTLAKWASEGLKVFLAVITDGSKGSEDPNLPPSELVRIREREQRAAASRLGLADVLFLGYEDGALEDSQALRCDLTRLIRRLRPSRVVCADPTLRWSGQGYINHPDHIAGGNATLFAVSLFARNRGSYPELLADGLEPFKVKHLYLSGTETPDCWVDIGDTLELKIAALKEHRSQIGDGSDVEPMIREWARASAEGQGMEYAESFKRFELS